MNSILGNMGNFWLSLFPIPKTVLKNIESLRRNFLWGNSENKKGINWIKWEKVCSSKEKGGLGVINMEEANLSLLTK